MWHASKSALLGLVVSTTVAGSVVGQDSQYWTNQYGNRARLLGGAVVGSSADLAAVYYNPGALALVENLEFVLAANVIQLTRYVVDSPFGSGDEISRTRLAGAPSLFAGEIPLEFLGDQRVAYSFLTRHSAEARLEERTLVDDPGPGRPGVDALAAEFYVEPKLSDYWAGLTWAIPVAPNVGLGFSPYVSVRSQRLRSQISGQAVDEGGDAALLLLQDSFDFQNWRLLAKIGASARFDPLLVGLTVTTPSLRLFGDGQLAVDRSFVSTSGVSDLLSSTQSELRADYRTPWSVAAGVGYSFERTRLHASAEWFGPIDPRVAVDAQPITSNAGEPLDADLVQEGDAVLNWAIGAQQRLRETVDAYLSFRTDRSFLSSDSADNIAQTPWDLWHLAGGVDFAAGPSEFTLGAVYAWGGSVDSDLDPLVGQADSPDEIAVRFRRWTVILGFSIVFE